ncbi:amidase [Cupriavidus basilensis]|uniref:amidase n=1 Tax=Cupriavidus basilensis TaxID=68895 RepID=UPI00157AEFC9|nr:amidase [Cupriavidus basilensis]NUA28892.1 amidase [Cupriavidus basilensis]
MNDFLALPARELAARMARRELSVQALVRAYIARIDAAEAGILAWQHFDGAQALQQARLLDAAPALGALHGLPIGVKDLMDTADMPTTYGSPIYAGHRPVMDAACVAMARAAGAVVMGKTVTTEFATFQPGPTRNPRASADAPRTPGGSSSGSAAAVAAGMVPIAFGTQTAGSIIRPAAYCGVVGYKPTFGTLPSAGIKSLSPSLDTVGVLARSVDDAAFFISAMARLPLTPPQTGQAMPLRVGICRTPHWERAGDDSRRALDTAARLLEDHGAVLSDLMLPAEFDELTQAQIDIMAYEAAAAFAPEMRARPDGFSSGFAALLAAGRGIDGSRFFAAQALASSARRAFELMFESVDIVLAPSAPGEAPAGLGATGDPMFNRMWTLLGNPCVHVPAGTGAHGMPVGVTLIGPHRGDARVLAAAQALERCVA